MPQAKPISWVEIDGGYNTPCWKCTSHKLDNRWYARYMRKRKRMYIAKKLWITKYWERPTGKLMCHRCNNRWCINPDHIYPGTYQSNWKDSAPIYPRVLLTQDDVRYIRKHYIKWRWWHPWNAKELADKFWVTIRLIRDISAGKRYNRVDPDRDLFD